MASIIPLPLISLYTAKMLEFAVCGKEQVDLSMLKKVVRYLCVCGGDYVILFMFYYAHHHTRYYGQSCLSFNVIMWFIFVLKIPGWYYT